MARTNWTHDELMLAFNLYCKIPFGKIHTKNPNIVGLAKILGRSPSAVAWKLANFAHLDPSLQARKVAGASHGSRLDAEVWKEFTGDWNRLAFESERLLAQKAGKKNGSAGSIDNTDWSRSGIEREALVRVRVNQGFFRSAVLAAYDYRCCITGLTIPDLLVASHIVPWSKDEANRVNPRNGLCLNALHDRAFDAGYLTITTKFTVKLSPAIRTLADTSPGAQFLRKFEGYEIGLPARFLPDPEFLKYHNRNVFRQH
jgi:putative restriction endonuclease